MSRLRKAKKVIVENFKGHEHGLFFTRNIVGDAMRCIFDEEGVVIDVCDEWAYFEIFNLSDKEQEEIMKFYDSLQKNRRLNYE